MNRTNRWRRKDGLQFGRDHTDASKNSDPRTPPIPILLHPLEVVVWLSKEDIPESFLPTGFSRSVFLCTLDLVDRCQHSTLVLLGRPKSLPLGDHAWPQVHQHWAGQENSVFDDLTQDALLDFVKDGAVVVDCAGGLIHEVSVLLSADVETSFTVKGGARTKLAFAVTRKDIDVIAVCKKLKPDSEDPSVARGWVSIFSSVCSKGESPYFYRYDCPSGTIVTRLAGQERKESIAKALGRSPAIATSCQRAFQAMEPQMGNTQSPKMGDESAQLTLPKEACRYERSPAHALDTTMSTELGDSNPCSPASCATPVRRRWMTQDSISPSPARTVCGPYSPRFSGVDESPSKSHTTIGGVLPPLPSDGTAPRIIDDKEQSYHARPTSIRGSRLVAL